MATSTAAKPAAIGGSARRGPCRSTIQARNGDTSTMAHAEERHREPGEPVAAATGRQRENQGKGRDPVTQAPGQ